METISFGPLYRCFCSSLSFPEETTITLPASASGTDADRFAARYAVEGKTWEAFDVEVFGERDRPQVVVRRV